MRLVPELSLEMSKQIAQMAEQKANELGLKVVISIFDNHGHLKHFVRMDATSHGSITVSQLKASTSSMFPLSSKQLADKNLQFVPNLPYQTVPGICTLEGGLPIKTGKTNTHIGSIGISGATPQLDGEVALAGIEGVMEDLADW